MKTKTYKRISVLFVLFLIFTALAIKTANASAATETDATVKDVAYSLGFESEFYFSRIFKSKTMKSPREYKTAQKKKE